MAGAASNVIGFIGPRNRNGSGPRVPRLDATKRSPDILRSDSQDQTFGRQPRFTKLTSPAAFVNGARLSAKDLALFEAMLATRRDCAPAIIADDAAFLALATPPHQEHPHD